MRPGLPSGRRGLVASCRQLFTRAASLVIWLVMAAQCGAVVDSREAGFGDAPMIAAHRWSPASPPASPGLVGWWWLVVGFASPPPAMARSATPLAVISPSTTSGPTPAERTG
jgi:hypothetical protein